MMLTDENFLYPKPGSTRDVGMYSGWSGMRCQDLMVIWVAVDGDSGLFQMKRGTIIRRSSSADRGKESETTTGNVPRQRETM